MSTEAPTQPSTVSQRTADLAALDHAHVWHPFTPMKIWRKSQPLIIERGDGDYLIDTEGQRYIDGVSSLWCNVHGHRVEAIDQAIRDQLDRIAHSTMLGLASVKSIELAKRLVEMSAVLGTNPEPLNKVFFSDAGATATELAIKMAIGYQYHTGHTNRDTIIAFTGAYHGDTVGAMSVGYSETFHRPFSSLTFRTVFAPAPDVTNSPLADETPWPWHDAPLRAAVRDEALSRLDMVIDQHADRAAAIMIEPLIQGAAGIVTHPEGFLKAVAQRATAHGIPLIADEVAVGLCRTGRTFACEHEGVRPDILCLAKGLSGGYLPLAATLCTDTIEQAFVGDPWEHRTLYHGHTFTGNPLGCAAALATLDLIEQNDLNAVVQQHERMIADHLAALRDHPHVFDVRQRGVMVGIDLVENRSPRTPFDPRRRLAYALCDALREQGLIVRPLGDTIILNPIPAMSPQTLERMMTIVVQGIQNFDFDN